MSSYSAKLRVSACAKVPRLRQPVLQVVDHDDAAGTHEPGRRRRVQPYRAGAEYRDRVALGDVSELCAEVPGGQGVGTQQRVLVVHPLRYQRRADVGERHPHKFGLAAVVAPAGVRVPVDAADGRGVRVHVVAVRVETTGAEVARTAEDVERHHHPITGFELLHRRSDLFDCPDELVAEGHANPGVRHHPVVEVEVGAADRSHRDPDDGVVGMFDRRLVFLFDAYLVRAAVDHRAHAPSSVVVTAALTPFRLRETPPTPVAGLTNPTGYGRSNAYGQGHWGNRTRRPSRRRMPTGSTGGGNGIGSNY